MSLIRRAAAQLERRAAEFGDSTPPPPSQLGMEAAGTTVSEMTALQVAAVYGSVGVISDAVATLPIELLTSTDPARREQLPLSPLLTQPYSEISLTDWWVQFVASVALRGNFYGHIIERDRDLYAAQIKPIHPDRASVRRLPSGLREYRFNGARVPIDDVVHVPYISLPGSLTGLNPIEYLRNTLGLARAADLYGGAFFRNSARPDVVLRMKGEADEDDVLALARQWKAAHQGIGMSNMPAVVTEDTEVETISINPEDAQFLESRQFSQGEISGMIFRVPPHMIGLTERSTSWGTGIEQQEMGFTRNTLTGYLTRGERMLTALHPPGSVVKFNLRERLRGDRLQRAQASALEIASGYLLPDEARSDEDRPPLPDGIGQTALAPINAQSLQDLAAASIAANRPQQGPPADDPTPQ